MAPSALDAHAGCGYEYGSTYYPGDLEWSGNRHREALRAFCQRRDRAPRLAVANIATIAADIAGVAGVLAMFLGVRWEFFVPAILLVLIMTLHLGYTRVKSILTLLTFVLLRYIVAVLIARPDWGSVVRATLIPQVTASSTWLVAALGLSGTTISPYLAGSTAYAIAEVFWLARRSGAPSRTSPRLLPGPIAQPGRWCNHLTVARFSSCCSAFL
jgi:hypothetical protein